MHATAVTCLQRTVNQCVDQERLDRLGSLIALGLDAACNEPRRCVKYGSIYEVKPGNHSEAIARP